MHSIWGGARHAYLQTCVHTQNKAKMQCAEIPTWAHRGDVIDWAGGGGGNLVMSHLTLQQAFQFLDFALQA